MSKKYKIAVIGGDGTGPSYLAEFRQCPGDGRKYLRRLFGQGPGE